MTTGDAELGAVIRRYDLDARAEGAVRTLRLAAAVVVLVGSVWIVAQDPGPIGWVVALLGGGVSLGWVVAFLRSRGRTREETSWFLTLHRNGLVLAEGGRRLQIPWAEVKKVEVDEDRLVVRLETAGDSPVIVEPRYRGTGVYDLEAAIREAWAGRAKTGASAPTDD